MRFCRHTAEATDIMHTMHLWRIFAHWRTYSERLAQEVIELAKTRQLASIALANERQLDLHATARRLVRRSRVSSRSIQRISPHVLRRELRRTRRVRTALRAWARLVALEKAARCITARSDAPGLFIRNSVLDNLDPRESREWPRAWQDFFGWSSSWREAARWLADLGIASPSVDTLLPNLRRGDIYVKLLDILCRANYFPLRYNAASSLGTEGVAETLQHFFETAHVRAILGDMNCRRVANARDHVRVLTYVRVVMEVDMPDKFAVFCRRGKDSHAPSAPNQSAADYSTSHKAKASLQHLSVTPHVLPKRWCGSCGVMAFARHEDHCAKCAMRAAIVQNNVVGSSSSLESISSLVLFNKTSDARRVRSRTVDALDLYTPDTTDDGQSVEGSSDLQMSPVKRLPVARPLAEASAAFTARPFVPPLRLGAASTPLSRTPTSRRRRHGVVTSGWSRPRAASSVACHWSRRAMARATMQARGP